MLLAALELGCGGGQGARDGTPGTGDVERGRELFARHGCASCHGTEGHGDGRFGAGLKPPPRDFRDLKAFQFGADIESMAATIGKGIVVDGTRIMPSFGHLSLGDRRDLAAFVHAFAQPAAADTATGTAATGTAATGTAATGTAATGTAATGEAAP